MTGTTVYQPLLDAPLPRVWEWKDPVIAAVAFVCGLILLGLVFALAAPVDSDANLAPLAFAGILVCTELMLGASVLAIAARRGVTLAQIGFSVPRRWITGPIALLGTYGVILTYHLAVAALRSTGFPTDWLAPDSTLPIDSTMSPMVLVVFAVGACVAAPLGEELMFRGLLFRAMRGTWRFLPAAVVSGLLFAALHVESGVFIPFALSGVILAWAYEQSRSLWIPIGVHATNNAIAFSVIFMELP